MLPESERQKNKELVTRYLEMGKAYFESHIPVRELCHKFDVSFRTIGHGATLMRLLIYLAEQGDYELLVAIREGNVTGITSVLAGAKSNDHELMRRKLRKKIGKSLHDILSEQVKKGLEWRMRKAYDPGVNACGVRKEGETIRIRFVPWRVVEVDGLYPVEVEMDERSAYELYHKLGKALNGSFGS